MDLFDKCSLSHQNLAAPINILPKDGVADYYGALLSTDVADDYFYYLLNEIAWQHEQAVIFGKTITTARKVAWYGEQPFLYRYSNTSKKARPWLKELQALKALVEDKTRQSYNSCLLNLYHSGEEGMAWHSDSESDLKKNGAIASLSLGAKRKFAFKHKQSKAVVALDLAHGSLLVMKGETQSHWLHRLPPTKKVTEPRINLTFRTIVS